LVSNSLSAHAIEPHCSGILNEDHTINNDASVARLAAISVAYAKAGAHVCGRSFVLTKHIKVACMVSFLAGDCTKRYDGWPYWRH
jgi:delta-aminolevulinic acid dehydratase/porphobilinogen synthase